MAHHNFTVPAGIEHPHSAATEKDVRELEATLGYILPDDYREFLKTVNGVLSTPGEHVLVLPIYDKHGREIDEPWDVASIFSISRDAECGLNFYQHQNAYEFQKRVPRKYIIIGGTGYFDQICMSLDGRDRGAIYWWLSANEGKGPLELDSTKFLYPVARSFADFWSKLRVDHNGE